MANTINNYISLNNLTILEEGTPLKIKLGRYSGETRNMYWKVKDNKTKNQYYLMHIKSDNDDCYTKFSLEDINKVLTFKGSRHCWRLFKNGYLCCSTYDDEKKEKVYYLHQLIMNVHDKDLSDMKETVDHINNDKLDNRKENLRLVDMSVQNANRPKAERRKDACDLPDGLVQKDLPKYVSYRKEFLDKETGKYREFFVVDNHHKLDKPWETTKSNKITLLAKLESAKQKLKELDEDKKPDIIDDKKLDLPVGISLTERNNKLQFCFDYRDTKNDIRYNSKMVLKSKDLQKELDNFIDIINKKYDTLNLEKYKIKNIVKIDDTKVSDNVVKEKEYKLPSNFSYYFDNKSNSNIFEYSKIITENGEKKRCSMKMKLQSDDVQKEFDIFVNKLNNKYTNLNIQLHKLI